MFAIRRMVKAFTIERWSLGGRSDLGQCVNELCDLLHRLCNHSAVAVPVYLLGVKCLPNSETA